MDIQRTFDFAKAEIKQPKTDVANESKPNTATTSEPAPPVDVYRGTAFTKAEREEGDRKYGWDPAHFTNNGEPLAGATEREIRNNRMFWRA